MPFCIFNHISTSKHFQHPLDPDDNCLQSYLPSLVALFIILAEAQKRKDAQKESPPSFLTACKYKHPTLREAKKSHMFDMVQWMCWNFDLHSFKTVLKISRWFWIILTYWGIGVLQLVGLQGEINRSIRTSTCNWTTSHLKPPWQAFQIQPPSFCAPASYHSEVNRVWSLDALKLQGWDVRWETPKVEDEIDDFGCLMWVHKLICMVHLNMPRCPSKCGFLSKTLVHVGPRSKIASDLAILTNMGGIPWNFHMTSKINFSESFSIQKYL